MSVVWPPAGAGAPRGAHNARAMEPTDADEDLMLAYARGDAAAFERLYDRHARPLHRFVVRCLARQAGEGVADEVFQETWLTVARQAAGWRPQARFATWLFTIARSRVIDQVRRNRAQGGGALVSIDDDAHAGLADALAADARGEPLAVVETRAQARAFVAALDALPADQREAFLLQAEAGLSVDEIAAATGVGAETAKSRLRYARARLRQALADWR